MVQARFPFRCQRLLMAGCWLSLCLSAGGVVTAAPADADGPGEDPVAVQADEVDPKTRDPKQTQKSLWLAFMMLGGIIVGGTLLLLMVVMWGNRTRRFARSPLPNVAKRDELWFLKPKPATGEPEEQAEPDENHG